MNDYQTDPYFKIQPLLKWIPKLTEPVDKRLKIMVKIL